MKRKLLALLLAVLTLFPCVACAAKEEELPPWEEIYTDVYECGEVFDIEVESVPLTDAPAAVDIMLSPVASGTLASSQGGAEIDYSNTSDGYVMCRFAQSSSVRLKVQVTGPNTTYTYDLPTGEWQVFPLTDGNGKYKTTVLKNVGGSKYACVNSVTCSVTLADEFAPFIRPNQYVNYEGAWGTITKAKEICKDATTELEKVQAVYDFVINNLTYDKRKAANVQTGYLPVLDSVLAARTGICFDYAALMAGMLRSQGVPCKLIVGYAGTAYHAWINVYTEETGWVEGAIYFNGETWQRMDPTFASSGKSSAAIMKYIGDGANYSAKYIY